MLPSYFTPRKVPYFRLDATKAFAGLSQREQRYAHHLSLAGWHGAAVCSSQVSSESPQILRFFHAFFSANPISTLKAVEAVKSDELQQFLEYAAMVYSNLGNYLSFGDSKFIPSCERSVFEAVVASAPNKQCLNMLPSLIDKIYSAEPSERELNFPPKGTTAYYGSTVTQEDAAFVDEFLKQSKIMPENTRVWKDEDGTYSVRIACATVRQETRTYEGKKIRLEFGDFSEHFTAIASQLEEAMKFAANDTQKKMLEHYVKHFKEGSMYDHKESQKEWIKDKGPVVESNIGFIETYRDPAGVRAEWEGFVAVVNKEQSRVYEELVNNAPQFISYLPWGTAFEKDTFSKPDFTSLEVLAFASSGVPLGICIPNYDDIRQDHGFKNVFLQNVVSAINFDDKMNHLTDADWEIYKTHFNVSMSLNVGLHELLGHGTGKLFMQNEDGTRNFSDVTNPLTGTAVTTCYKPGETWSSMFKDISNAYEECRAEAVSLYLGVYDDILAVFGLNTDEDRNKCIHLEWLNMCRAGLVGLEFYSPETKQWRQAHMRARFCILNTLLRQENSIIKITFNQETDFLEITIDAPRIKTDGKRAIGDLLRHLNINKSICDVSAGTQHFEDLTSVSDYFLAIRETVMKVRKPRKQFIQSHTRVKEDGSVELMNFDGSVEGAIEAFVTRHQDIPL